MKMTLTTTIAALAALAWPPPSTGAVAAQETTAQEALEQLRRAERPDYTSAVRILRQASGPRTSAELNALADRAAAIAADATLPDDVRVEARFALAAAASADGEGAPYPRAFDLLVEVYEGGYDAALYTLFRTDSVRGMAYVRELFDRSERPPLCPRPYPIDPLPGCEDYRWQDDARDTPFCKAGRYLFEGIVDEAWKRTPGGRYMVAGDPMPVPDGLPEHVEDWHRRCL